jgi:hypothetical protein
VSIGGVLKCAVQQGDDMNLKAHLDDDAMIEHGDGTRSGPYKTKFAGNALLFVDGSLPIEEGDVVIQTLPGGRERRHVAIEVNHISAVLGLVEPHCSVTVRSEAAHRARQAPAANTTNVTVSGGTVQIGNHNAQTITSSFQTLVHAIESSNFSQAEKVEAKGKLRSVLENPVVAAVLGAAVQGIVTGLSS